MKILSIGVVFFLVLALIIGISAYSNSETEVTITVTKTEAVNSGKSYKYLVFTENEVFEIDDSLVFWKFDSSDTYNQMKSGKTYTVKVAGWRNHFFSMYRNIIQIISTTP